MAVLEEHRPSHLVMAGYLDAHRDLPDMDRSFVKRLVIGVVERRITLDHVIDSVSKTKTAGMKPVIRNIILMGVYQLLYMNVPDSAACNESVKLTKKRGLVNLSGFVNGVLRNIARNKEELAGFGNDNSENNTGRMSIRYSMPEWIVRYFLDNYGEEAAIKAFDYYFEPSKTCIRCNASRISPEELFERLTARGICVSRTERARCMVLRDNPGLGSIPEFTEGLFTVQDMSSVMAGEIADVAGNEVVLDLCAAPGGKSMNIADRLTTGSVLACDISEQKVAMIEENIRRCRLNNISTRVNDAAVFVPEFEAAFDIVIADVPCSGLGIIGRKPDIKYNMSPEGQKELVTLQRRILDNAVRYVRPGGQLLFSTCTVNRAENEENVAYIAAKGYDCELQRQLLPGDNGADGFFYSKLIRK